MEVFMHNETPVNACLSMWRAATKYHEEWWKRFRVTDNMRYYEGQQWAGYSNYFRNAYRPCVVNLIFSTIKVQLPSLLFSEPVFNISPKKSLSNPEQEARKSNLQEAALNTFVTDPDNLFSEEVEDAIIDSYFAFGLLEVGFDSNYIINPNADKPYARKDGMEIQDIEGKNIIQPKEIPEWEQVYVKRIHPAQFRVGGMDSKYLTRCNWVAYYEYVDVLDLKGNKALKHIKDLPHTGARTEEFEQSYNERESELQELLSSGDVIKLWHWWDLRKHEFRLFTDIYNDDYLFQADFSHLPLFPLKYHNRRRGFYPIPPVSQWLSPQDDLNEANEQLRVHRRRGARKYFVRKGILDTDEFDKVLNGPDGTFGEVEGDPATAAAAVPLAPLDSSVDTALILSKDNFNVVSGTRSEARGESDRTTATQAAIVDARSKIRETRPKIIVAKWLNKIGRAIVLNMQQITLPFWVKVSNTREERLLGSIQETQMAYEEISGNDLEDFDFDVSIKVSSMSPISQEEDKNKFLEFMAVLNQYPQIALSPTLIREAAERIGFNTNEKVLRELQDMALAVQYQQMQQMQQESGALGQRTVAKATPSNMEKINNQLTNQVGLPTQ